MPPMLSQSSKISPALPLTPKCFYNIAPPQVRGQGLLLRFLLIKVFAAELESSSSSSSWHYVNSCHLESPNSFRRDETSRDATFTNVTNIKLGTNGNLPTYICGEHIHVKDGERDYI